jgi:amino acid transporter
MEIENSKKEITNTHLLFISFAAIFGSGWLFAPLYAAQIAGPASLIAWVLGAAMSAVIGVTMAEVVVLFPKTGGLSQISKSTHGEFLSLSITVFNLLVFIILPAIEVRAVLQYLSSYFKVIVISENSVSIWSYVLAFFLIALITLVNLYGAKITAFLTKAVVLFKLVTPVLLCGAFLCTLGSSGTFDHSRLVVSTIPWSGVFQAIATSGIIFSFNGFNQATLFAGEAKNPQKAVPFAILGSLLISGLLYFLIQYVFLMAVPQESFINGWDKLSFSGDEGPFAGIAALLGLGWLLTLIYADAVVSPLGTAFAYASSAPRLFHALFEGLSEESRFLKPNRYGISPATIGITFVLECLAFVFLPSLKAMIALLVSAFVLCYTVAPASLLVLRRTQPELHRPFRVRMAPTVSLLSLFFSNLMVFSCGWVALKNLLIVSLGLFGVYLVFHLKNHEREVIQKKIQGSAWFLFQLCSIGGLCWYDHHFQPSFLGVSTGIGGISLIALMLSQFLAPRVSRV